MCYHKNCLPCADVSMWGTRTKAVQAMVSLLNLIHTCPVLSYINNNKQINTRVRQKQGTSKFNCSSGIYFCQTQTIGELGKGPFCLVQWPVRCVCEEQFLHTSFLLVSILTAWSEYYENTLQLSKNIFIALLI